MERINKKIKQIRFEKEMTLKDLSEETGLSISFLSQIERGSTSLAITSLKKIAESFNVNMTYFFEEIENHNYVLKEEDQTDFKVEGSDVKHIRLAGKFPLRKLEPIKVIIQPNHKYEELFSHPGEEFYYVIEGTIMFKIEDKEYVLNEGDTIHFPSEKVHQWSNPTSEETILLSVLTPVIF